MYSVAWIPCHINCHISKKAKCRMLCRFFPLPLSANEPSPRFPFAVRCGPHALLCHVRRDQCHRGLTIASHLAYASSPNALRPAPSPFAEIGSSRVHINVQLLGCLHPPKAWCVGMLSNGAIAQMHANDTSLTPNIQLLEPKQISPGPPCARYRMVLSDGENFMQGMLSTQLNPMLESGQARVPPPPLPPLPPYPPRRLPPLHALPHPASKRTPPNCLSRALHVHVPPHCACADPVLFDCAAHRVHMQRRQW